MAGSRGPLLITEILRIAGNEKHPQIGPRLARRIRHLTSVHSAGKTDVANQKIDPDIRLQQLESGHTIRRVDHRVAEFFQHIGDQHAHARFIVDDQNGFARIRTRDRRRGVIEALAIDTTVKARQVDAPQRYSLRAKASRVRGRAPCRRAA